MEGETGRSCSSCLAASAALRAERLCCWRSSARRRSSATRRSAPVTASASACRSPSTLERRAALSPFGGLAPPPSASAAESPEPCRVAGLQQLVGLVQSDLEDGQLPVLGGQCLREVINLRPEFPDHAVRLRLVRVPLVGTETDAATELQVSNSKLVQMETAFTAQRTEYERLKRHHTELEEKLEASEIQNKQQSTEYRNLLQQRDMQTLQQSSHVAMLPLTTTATSTSSTMVPTSSSSSFLPHTVGAHHGFHGDEMDLSDVLWSQQEINRLSTEVTRLEAELSHWRRVAQRAIFTNEEDNVDMYDIV
ncbi:hypothetical protein CRUP_036154 [Coryphaenoides rupestris]|nr:hypothetical protein CRUP_036154 [Coryphaenoides rupestris]